MISDHERAINWEETARQYARDVAFYRGIVEKVGETFGVFAHTSDDGSVQQTVLALKVPELVAELHTRAENLGVEVAHLQSLSCPRCGF